MIACLALLQGCTSSSGVTQTGPDTYMIARSRKGFRGDSGTVKAEALKEANKWCAQNGKVMKVISSAQKNMVPFTSDANAEVHFKALDPDSPELKVSTDTGALKTRVFRGDENFQSITVDRNETTRIIRERDTYDDLLKLSELRKSGIITDEEFEAEKKKLLAGER